MREPFDVMVTEEKLEEFRKVCDWMTSRLYEKNGDIKHYDYIEYTNGYGHHRPRFVTDYLGFELVHTGIRRSYSNGLEIDISDSIYVIRNSKVLIRYNI